MKRNSSLHMIITLMVISVVVGGLMSYFNSITEPIIEENNIRALNESLSEIIDADEHKLQNYQDNTVYVALKNNEKVGVLVNVTVKGYGGDMAVLTGVDNDGNVVGVEILSNAETAGLGANAVKPEFKDQYIGKTAPIGVSKVSASSTKIKAITGATITSEAVTDAVNKALEIAKNF